MRGYNSERMHGWKGWGLVTAIGLLSACGGDGKAGTMAIDSMNIELDDGFTYLVLEGRGFGEDAPQVVLTRVSDAETWTLPVSEFSSVRIRAALPATLSADWYVVEVRTLAGEVEAPLLALSGQDGADGVHCWDLDGDGEADLATEDRNGDGTVTVEDCKGTGAPGLHCWDLDGDGTQDASEDVNDDGLWNVLDCRGPAGADGFTSLLLLEDEPAGGSCPYGGSRLSIGIDWDRDGVLEGNEIDQVEFFCNGDGSGQDGLASLVTLSPEPAGANCPAGGKKIESGLDADRDGVLDPGEVASVSYICAGEIVNVLPEAPGANCAAGGMRVETGIDHNGSGVLDPGEIATVDFICHGIDGMAGTDGSTTLVTVQAEAPGSNCAYGGSLVRSGLDLNDNGVLDAGEETASAYLCHGADGAAGTDGLSSLVRVENEAPGPNCANGGTVIYAGLDDNLNGLLEAGEIDHTSFVCRGATGPAGSDGATSLIRLTDEPAGAHCAEGGTAIQVGLDTDADGVLDPGEITSTAYVCHGSDGTAYVCDEGEIRYVLCGLGNTGEQRQECDASHNWINVGTCDFGEDTSSCPAISLGFTQLTATAPSFACASHSVVAHGGELWVFDGNNVHHSPDGVSWTQEADAPYPAARCYHNAVSWLGKIWILAGDDGLNDVWSFEHGGAGWVREVAVAPFQERERAAAVVFLGDLYLMGGESTASYNSLNDIWRTSDGLLWTQVAAHAPWSVREGLGASILGSELTVVFGYPADDVWRSPDGNTWYQVVQDVEPLASRRAPLVTYDNRLWSLGGWATDAWFSEDGVTWCQGNESLGFLTGAWNAAVLFNGQIVLVGSSGQIYAAAY
jgi:hypothetical protein